MYTKVLWTGLGEFGMCCLHLPANKEVRSQNLTTEKKSGRHQNNSHMSRTGGKAEVKVATKKGRCCTRQSWEQTLWMYKILIGLMCIFVSLYDYILKPLILQEKVNFEIRGATIDFFFLTFV